MQMVVVTYREEKGGSFPRSFYTPPSLPKWTTSYPKTRNPNEHLYENLKTSYHASLCVKAFKALPSCIPHACDPSQQRSVSLASSKHYTNYHGL